MDVAQDFTSIISAMKERTMIKRVRTEEKGFTSIRDAVRMICESRAIDCGYAALANAIEGRNWERRHYLNLMRRFMSLAGSE